MAWDRQTTKSEGIFSHVFGPVLRLLSLLPLRIAHHPGVVIRVFDLSHNSAPHLDQSNASSSNSDARSISGNVDSLRVTHGQSLVIRSQGLQQAQVSPPSSDQRCITYVHEAPAPTQGPREEGSHHYTPQNEQLHQLQLQIDKALHEVQQSSQKIQQQQQQVDNILQRLEQSDQRMDQSLRENQQQLNDILYQLQQPGHQVDQLSLQQQQTDHQVQQQQQQIDNILQKIQEAYQDGHEMIQHIQKTNRENDQEASLQQVRKDIMGQLQNIFQRQRQEFDHLMVAKSRAQAVLARSSKEFSDPRLFIVLPKATGLIDQNGRWCSFQFRLYYLCDCGTHTMGDDGKTRHEIHLAQHPGYDLRNHGAFFEKFGPYLLMMMYMVKYGAMSAGRFVPPLSDLKLDMDQEQLHFPKEDIGRQVDDMIAYLESTILVNSRNEDPSSKWELDTSELALLKSYLEAVEDEDVLGNLCHSITRDRHSVWVCSEHQREYHESALVWVKDLVVADCEECIEDQGKTTIKIKSDTLAKQFLEAMEVVSWVRGLNKKSGRNGYDAVAMSTSYILIDRDTIHSLILDFGRFTLSASITKGGTRNLGIEMEKLSDLTRDDLASILRCHHNRLTIRNTPQEADEDRLVSLLQHSAKLEVLRIVCKANRSLAVVNLIISARETVLQNGSLLPLRTFEMMDEGLVPIDMYSPCDSSGHITSTLKFSKDVNTFDMSTDLKFPIRSSGYGPVLDFVRNFGWTVENLLLSEQLDDKHIRIILDAVRDRGSRIRALSIAPNSLTTAGMDVLDEIIEMSPNVVSIGMRYFYLGDKTYLSKVENSLTRYKAQLHHLRLHGNKIGDWLPQIAGIIPSRDILPKMNALTLDGGNEVSKDCITWIVTMISAPPQPPSATALPEPWTRLKRITLRSIVLSPEDWESVIRAIDLTELEWLNLKTTNFAYDQLGVLVNQIIDNVPSQARERTFCIDKKLLEQEEARTLCATLREKVPLVKFN